MVKNTYGQIIVSLLAILAKIKKFVHFLKDRMNTIICQSSSLLKQKYKWKKENHRKEKPAGG